MAFRKYPVKRLMRGLWADVYECEIRETGRNSAGLYHGEEHVFDLAVFMRHDRTVDVQVNKQGLSLCTEITDVDPDEVMATMLTVLHFWKERVDDDSLWPKVKDRILRTLRSSPPNGTGSVSPSLCLALEWVEAQQEMITGALAESVRDRMVESMRWLQKYEGLDEQDFVRLWREESVRRVLED